MTRKFTDPTKLSLLVEKFKYIFDIVATSKEILQKLFVDQQSQLLDMTGSNESGTGSGSKNEKSASPQSPTNHEDQDAATQQIQT